MRALQSSPGTTHVGVLGVTLLEVLQVVTLIGVLTGLAANGYLEAHYRAKRARVVSDLRTLATAVETYTVDHNSPPRMRAWDIYEDPAFDKVQGQRVNGTLSPVLSTPIAYLSSSDIPDVYMTENKLAPFSERVYTYQDIPARIKANAGSKFWPPARQFYGEWRLGSFGPDQMFNHGFINSGQLPYDPTNGVVSLGNIWRSQKNDSRMPPIPELLGRH